MGSVIDRATVQFLVGLKKNNHREWFEANRRDYESARENLIEFTDGLIREIEKFDKSIKGATASGSIFRIFRDTRFSKEKTPYKTNFGAFVKTGGKRETGAGYYLHIEPGQHYLGGGIYRPPTEDLLRIRTGILEKCGAYKKIIQNPQFKNTFGEVGMDSLKTVPKGFDRDHPDIALVRFKSYVAGCNIKEGELLSKHFQEEAVKMFRLFKPFNGFLNSAIGL